MLNLFSYFFFNKIFTNKNILYYCYCVVLFFWQLHWTNFENCSVSPIIGCSWRICLHNHHMNHHISTQYKTIRKEELSFLSQFFLPTYSEYSGDNYGWTTVCPHNIFALWAALVSDGFHVQFKVPVFICKADCGTGLGYLGRLFFNLQLDLPLPVDSTGCHAMDPFYKAMSSVGLPSQLQCLSSGTAYFKIKMALTLLAFIRHLVFIRFGNNK